ncbi:MAG: hypothetical protein MRJ96_08575 [Nitrospirales bacterium]|nr:hypothetical protein [Nitrospirales bacterium]
MNDVSTTIGSLTALLGTGTLTVGDATSTAFAGILSETAFKAPTLTLILSDGRTGSAASNKVTGSGPGLE